jgi:lipopolysaccharide export system permease protein
MHEGNVPGQIRLYEFGEDTQLLRALRARKAEVSADRTWLFKGVREKRLVDGRLVTRHHRELKIGNLWAPDELPTLALPSKSMSLSVLYRYAQFRADNELPPEKYLSTFWQRLLMPLTVGAMVLLATPISANLSAGRDRSFGISLAIGAIVGILFYLGAQIVFALGQLMELSIPLVAVLPAALVTLCAAVMLKRMNW